MIDRDRIDFVSQGFDENGIAFVSYKNRDSVFCINQEFEKVSYEFEYIKHVGKNLYVFPDEFGSEAYFKFKDDNFIKASRTFSGFLGEFNNGIALVQEDDGIVDGRIVYYYIDRKFKKVSPVFAYAEEFSEQGVARAIDFDGYNFYIDTDYQRISPLFTDVSLLDDNDIIVAGEDVNGEEYFSYFKLSDGKFNRISKSYSKCYHFNGEVAIVQDANSKKWYLIDREFNQVSKEFDNMSKFVNVPQIVKAETGGKKVFLSKVTGLRVSNPNLYNETLKVITNNGYEDAINCIKNSGLYENATKSDLSDLKVAIKDYLVKNVNKINYSVKKKTFCVVEDYKFCAQTQTAKAISDWITKEVNLAPTRLQNLDSSLDAE